VSSSGEERPSRQSTQADPLAATPAALPRGTIVGRYLIVDFLGVGGMGMVYAAYDSQLNRRVAIKLVRSSDETSRDGRVRMLREAQAMARLAHPNVRAIYDVGDFRDQVFIAMELVEGRTLDRWLEEQPRSVRAILEVFRQAGRGLAAAHDSGLVHRDFKPQNVLVGQDGRVRVTDFGLARAAHDETPAAQFTPVREDPLQTPLTQTGAALGTPMYMAPEQRSGAPVDERADQYSFCLSLQQALGDRAPRFVRELCERGLLADPAGRFPSMNHLLAALSRDPAIAMRRVAVGALLLAAVAVSAYSFLHRSSSVCKGAERRLAGFWDANRRREVHEAFAHTGVPYAEDTFRAVERALDAYGAAWAAMRTEACEATHVRGEQSQALMDLRMQCLDERLQELRAQVDVFAKADAKVVEKAVRAAESIGRIEPCADAAALRAVVRPPADGAAVEALRAELARAKAEEHVGRYSAGLALLSPIAPRMRALGYRPLDSEVLYELGVLQLQSGDLVTSERTLEDAALEAEASRDEAQAARAWTALVGLGERRAKYEQAEAWGRHAFAALEAAGGSDEIRGRLLDRLGSVLAAQGKYDQAIANHRQGLALREKALGPEHAEVAASLNNLGNALDSSGKYEEALASYQRALAIAEKAQGKAHPDVAAELTNLGIVLEELGRLGEAEASHRRALAIVEKTLGPEHPQVAASRVNLGTVLQEQHRTSEALVEFRRAVAIEEKTVGPDHPDLANALNNIGNALETENKLDQALPPLRRALAIREKALGAGHPDVGASLANIASVLAKQGKRDEAIANYKQALAIWEKTLPPTHPYIKVAREGLANLRSR
jgi:eukaryotic-like serine/threonine-protein kinase